MEEACYSWGLKDSPQILHLDLPHDSARGSYTAWGPSHCHDPMLGGPGGSASSPMEEKTLPSDDRIDLNMLQQVNSLLEDKFPNFLNSPDVLSATQDSDMPPSVTHPHCQREGAINVVDETVVAGVDGLVPVLDDRVLMFADIKPYTGTSAGVPGSAIIENQLCIDDSGKIRVPISAKGENQAYTGTLGGVPTCITENQVYGSTSGVPASTKSGSQAIDYVRTDAVLETYGIPAFSPQTLSLHTPGTDMALLNTLALPDQDTSTKRTVPGVNTNGTSSAGTVGCNGVPREGIDATVYPSGTGPNTVPGKDLITQDKPAIRESLTSNKFDIVSGTVSDTKIVPQLTGTQHTKFGTFIDPQKVEIIRTLSIVSIDPNKLVPEIPPATVTYSPGPLGTQDTPEGAVPGSAAAYGTNLTDTVEDDQDNEMKNAKKRIRKRKKAQGTECQQKVPKYKQGPQNDVIEERKRQDAMRAKRGRDRNRQKMEELQEANSRLEEEKTRLTEEVVGRRRWEMALLAVLRGHGIDVTPYGTGGVSSHQMSPATPVTSPAQVLVASPAQLPMMSPAAPVTSPAQILVASPAQLPMMSPATPSR